MHQIKYTLLAVLVGLLTLSISSCSLIGNKKNSTVDDVFKQGAIDPNLVPNNVSYVPIYPFINNVNKPLDVFVGYDEFTYVVVDNDDKIMFLSKRFWFGSLGKVSDTSASHGNDYD